MDACGCDEGFEIFDRKTAESDLARYREHGPDRTTRLLLDLIGREGVGGASVLDVGGGIGTIDHELLREGEARATLVDAAAPSLAMAREEAQRRGHLDRLEIVDGDFVARASGVESADIVTLDRVICCYPDMVSLVRLSAQRARRLYGLVLPRDRAILRAWLALQNAWFRLRGIRYRGFLHPNDRVDALVREAGLRPIREDRTFVWRVVVYERATG
jgi:2-polyprenyl-3-methyl-5-hydroxy-6-metoxy-1,4-benzoquinol methylase